MTVNRVDLWSSMTDGVGFQIYLRALPVEITMTQMKARGTVLDVLSEFPCNYVGTRNASDGEPLQKLINLRAYLAGDFDDALRFKYWAGLGQVEVPRSRGRFFGSPAPNAPRLQTLAGPIEFLGLPPSVATPGQDFMWIMELETTAAGPATGTCAALFPATPDMTFPLYADHDFCQSYVRFHVVQALLDNLSLPPELEQHREDLVVIHGDGPGTQDGSFEERKIATRRALTRARLTVFELPAPRMLKSFRDAEAYARDVMNALGAGGARLTQSGADGGLDVVSDRAVAQVKMEANKTSRPQVQALLGAAYGLEKQPLFFSLAGFTRDALEWAAAANVACFEFAYDGSVSACGAAAERLLIRGLE